MKNSAPKLTVLMPVYNARAHIGEAIDSILNQTFRDFEFLIVDDGSTDDSGEIALARRDSRIRFVKNEKNLGISATLNKGLHLARTDLVARMDADDISYPDRLSRQVEYMRDHPDCSLVCSYARVISEEGQEVEKHRVRGDFFYYHLAFGNLIYHPTVLYRRSAVEAAGGYADYFCEDYSLWCRLIRNGRFHVLPEVLLDYRDSKSSLSNCMHRTEYDRGERAQVTANLRHFMGRDYTLPDAYLECYRHNVEPILQKGNVGEIVNCLRELEAITARILMTGNVNGQPGAIRMAARRKRLVILAAILPKLPMRRRIELLARLRSTDFIHKRVRKAVFQ